MNHFVIRGGKRLEGELKIDASKNATLPIIAATLLTKGITYLENCPKILDVFTMIEILKELGCKIEWCYDTLKIDTSTLDHYDVSDELVKKMRSSIILLGALLGRCSKAKIGLPGGCPLGKRPIDLHLSSLKKMGVNMKEEDGFMICTTSNLQGAQIDLTFPSVGATQNIMLAAALAEGETIINHAAREPEIVDLQNYLNACGCKIKGAGTNKIVIQGVKNLKGIHYKVIPDRIIAGTYLAAAAITRGNILLKNVEPKHLQEVLKKFREIGCEISEEETQIYLNAQGKLGGTRLETKPYPGYPTDMQAQMMALLCTASSKSQITETLFEARFKHVHELNKMQANILVEGQSAKIMPVKMLKGCEVYCEDLRGGAALVIAGLFAEEDTKVYNIHHIKRGYENIVKDLHALGANIEERE